MSLPNGKAQMLTKKLFYKFKHLRFIDLSVDFRIQSPLLYKKWYNLNHYAKDLINKTLYSISEFSKKNKKLQNNLKSGMLSDIYSACRQSALKND